MQEILSEFPEVDNGLDPSPAGLEDGSTLKGAQVGSPRKGGDFWRGEAEAKRARQALVGTADGTGRLRGILDAVRSNRLEDDFSDCWSFSREDFERKLHHKRAKVKVIFVELPDTVAVQGPESEIVGNMVTNDFLALLDVKERQIVMCLNSGITKLTEIAQILGYANHSPVSKKLTRIRHLAEQHLRNS